MAERIIVGAVSVRNHDKRRGKKVFAGYRI